MTLAQALAALPDTADGIAAHLAAADIQGRPGSACHCPIATYLTRHGFGAVHVDEIRIWVGEGACQRRMNTPPAVAAFMRQFDRGEWPALVVADV